MIRKSSPSTNRAIAPVEVGDVIAGKYVVEKIIGAGGHGIVAAARHQKLDEQVAIKFLLAGALHSQDMLERFQREARAAVKLKTEHVARVLDIGVLENGAPFMIMEYLEGVDLAAYLREHGPLPVSAAVDYVLQACVALAEAHSLGIVHRDVKPANLFLARRRDGKEVIKVLDFGISKSLATSTGRLTTTNAVIGSPCYMSPEQMSSPNRVDHRADIWSLGITLYELLSGDPPFSGSNLPQICLRIMKDPVRSLSELGTGAPVELEPILLRCLEKDPDRRYGSVADLASALAPFSGSSAGDAVQQVARLSSLPARPLETVPLHERDTYTLSFKRPGDNTESTWRRTIGLQSVAPRGPIPTGIIALLGVVSIWGVITLIRLPSSSMPSAAAPDAESIASAGRDLQPPRSEPSPVASTEVSANGGIPVDPGRASRTPEPPAASAPTASATAHRKSGPPPGGVAGAQKSASDPAPSSCSEPRYVDAQGIVRIRRECIH
jgi:serine/threonine-protein kinase